MDFTFYIQTDKPNKVVKQLLNGYVFSGSISEFSTSQKPTLNIRGFDRRFNYCYIETYKRYYFVKYVVEKQNNTFQIELECDFLMSFKDFIKDSYGLVNISDNPNTFLSNRQMVTNSIPTITDYELPDVPFQNDLNIILLTQK